MDKFQIGDTYTTDFAEYVAWCRGAKDREIEAKKQRQIEYRKRYNMGLIPNTKPYRSIKWN